VHDSLCLVGSTANLSAQFDQIGRRWEILEPVHGAKFLIKRFQQQPNRYQAKLADDASTPKQ
jgi:hypothetical protein